MNPFELYFAIARLIHLGLADNSIWLQEKLLADMERYCEERWRNALFRIPWWRFKKRREFHEGRTLWIDKDYDSLWDEAEKAHKEIMKENTDV